MLFFIFNRKFIKVINMVLDDNQEQQYGFNPMIILLVIFCMAVLVFLYNRYVTHKVDADQSNAETIQKCSAIAAPMETIFVIIPSFNADAETALTICDLFAKAVCPYRVFVGVCDYFRSGVNLDGRSRLKRVIELEMHKSGRNLGFIDHNVRFYSQPTEQARGSTVARSVAYTNLYHNEMYIMTCESQTIFVPEWDLKSIDQLRRCRLDYMRPVLTTQPDDWPVANDRNGSANQLGRAWKQNARFTCIGGIAKTSGLPLVASRPMSKPPMRPTEQMFYSPCWSFTFAVLYKDVPFDPNYKYTTAAEDDIATSARMWTSGWNFIVPFEAMAWRNQQLFDPSRPDHYSNSERRHSEKRMQVLLNVRDYKNRPKDSVAPIGHDVQAPGVSPYALGSVRTLREYEVFTGLDFPNCRATQKAIVGVVKPSDPIEVMCKFGSNEAYSFVLGSTNKQYKYNL